MKMYLSPAEYVVRIFGGVRRTAAEIGRSPAAVSKWSKPIENHGCGGKVPRLAQETIMHIAKLRKLDITPSDLMYGRSIKKI
jgi:hypothetical protein